MNNFDAFSFDRFPKTPFLPDVPLERWTPDDGDRDEFFMRAALVEAQIAAVIRAGIFEPGYAFDAVVIDDSDMLRQRDYTPSERIERCAYVGSFRTSMKFVDGHRIL